MPFGKGQNQKLNTKSKDRSDEQESSGSLYGPARLIDSSCVNQSQVPSLTAGKWCVEPTVHLISDPNNRLRTHQGIFTS